MLRDSVLVADDYDDAAESLAEVLESIGYVVSIARNGRAALEAARASHPDIVLLDIEMPYLSGYDVCRKIRAEPWGSDALIVAISGRGHEDDKRESRRAGFDFHLVKPIDLERLVAILR